MSSKHHILFDLDGTLTDSFKGIVHSVQYALSRYGIVENDLHKLTPFIGPPLTYSFREFYHFSDAQADEAVRYYCEERLVREHSLSRYPGDVEDIV